METEKTSPYKGILFVGLLAFFDGITETYIYSGLPSEIFKLHISWIIKTFSMLTMIDFFIYRAISSVFWGVYMDKFGRKKALSLSLPLVSSVIALYAIFPWDILRIAQRLFNGLFIFSRVLSTEVVDDSYKPWSIAFTSSAWIIGLMSGPLLGYLLPFEETDGILSILIAGLGFFIAHKSDFLEETLGKDKTEYHVISQGINVQSLVSLYNDLEPLDFESSLHDPVVEDNSGKNLLQALETKVSGRCQPIPVNSYGNQTKIIWILAINIFFGSLLGVVLTPWLHNAGVSEAVASLESEEIWPTFFGGLVPLTVAGLMLYPFLQLKRSDTFVLIVGHLIQGLCYLLLPLGEYLDMKKYLGIEVWLWVWIYLRNVASFLTFCSLQRYFNDIQSSEKRGKMNGLIVLGGLLVQSTMPYVSDFVFVYVDEQGNILKISYLIVFIVMFVITGATLRIAGRIEFTEKRPHHSDIEITNTS